MAKLTPGVGFSSASGKLAGLVYSQGPTGQVLRAAQHARTSRSAQSFTHRQQFLGIVSSWRALTDAQQHQWDSFALEVEQSAMASANPFANGFQAYVRCNLNLLETGNTPLSSPGPITRTALITWLAGSMTLSSNSLMIGFSKSFGDSAQNVLYATSPIPQGVRNYQSRSFRKLVNNSGGSVTNRFSVYNAFWFWPNSSLAGQYIVIRLRLTTLAGLRSNPWDQVIQIQA